MERKCEVSGSKFEVSSQELSLIKSNGFSIPKRSEIERVRYFLSFVPDINSIMNGTSAFYLNSENSYLPSIKIENLSSLPFSKDRFPDLTGENCFNYLADLFNYWRFEAEKIHSSVANFCCYNCKDISDTAFSYDSEFLVNCVFVNNGRRLYSAKYSSNCTDSYFIENCEDCSHCLFCANLKGKKYFVFNQEVSVEEYESIFQSLLLGDPLHLESAHERYANFLKVQAINAISIYNSKSVNGRFVNNAKNSRDIYFSSEILNSALIFGGYEISGSVGLVISGGDIKNSYQSILLSGVADSVRNSYLCGPNIGNLDYSIGCRNSNDLMFCVGLENASYCIFNQQFGEKDYLIYREKVIKMFSRDFDWGTKLPSQFSLTAYNGSLANLLFPLSKVQANLLGLEWNDELDFIKIDREGSEMHICEISGEFFEVSEAENSIRSELGLAVPTRAPGQRFKDLLVSTEFGPRKESICGQSSKTFEHNYKGSRLVIS